MYIKIYNSPMNQNYFPSEVSVQTRQHNTQFNEIRSVVPEIKMRTEASPHFVFTLSTVQMETESYEIIQKMTLKLNDTKYYTR
jgi:hypothetical protein